MRESGLRYGADGYPYLLGLGAGAAAASTLAAALARSGRRHRWLAVPAAVVAAAAAAPAMAGLHYVLRGKLLLRQRVLDVVSWRGDETVVDLGAGGGLLAIGATARTRGVVRCVDLFVAKDLSGNTEARLLRNVASAGVADRVEVLREDVRATSLADGSVDVVLSSLCLHNIGSADGRAQALREVVRVLRPGGVVVLSDLAHVDDEYAPLLRGAGLAVELLGRVPSTFPPQRMLVARDVRGGGDLDAGRPGPDGGL